LISGRRETAVSVCPATVWPVSATTLTIAADAAFHQ